MEISLANCMYSNLYQTEQIFRRYRLLLKFLYKKKISYDINFIDIK